MKSYVHKGMKLLIADNGRLFICGEERADQNPSGDRAPFELRVSGGEMARLGANNCCFEGVEEQGDKLVLKYNYVRESLMATVTLTFTENSSVILQENSIKNYGDTPKLLTSFSSSFVDGIATGNKKFYEKDIMFHICNSKWQAEGQWHKFDADTLGLLPATTHGWEQAHFDMRSSGSWSTGAGYYPCVIVEDKTDNRVWFMESEGSQSWMMRISSYGDYNAITLALEATGCDESVGAWHYELKPGEEYTAPRAYFGTAKGGFEEAVCELNEFKRADSLVKYENGYPPVAFNDYMDCIWGEQWDNKILPLIDKAAELGCELFCIDGGWCKNQNGLGLGDYIAKEDHFANYSLEELANIIKGKGMIPGIWLELDACNNTAFGYKPNEDWVIKRYGRCVGENGRHFYNFCNKDVRDYLKGIIKNLYDMGYRYIKNDYNQTTGIGCTNNYDGDSPSEGLIRNNAAFLSFIDELYVEFPGLVIENCGSGGMREDNSMLRHFALQSTSDQELYDNNPSIVMGSVALMPPEKAGIWSYPYPAMIDERLTFTVTDEYRSRMADGRQTVFNMVNAMNGVLYLSGRVDLCDEKNFDYIKEAIGFYKDIRASITKSRPIYPLGMCTMNAKKLTCLGLLSDDRLLLSVWNITEAAAEKKICLEKYISGKNVSLKRVYTTDGNAAKLDGAGFSVKLEGMSAMFIELSL